MLFSGGILIGTQPFRDQISGSAPLAFVDYLSVAPLISIAGFYSGYDPLMFSGLLSRAKKIARQKVDERVADLVT